MKKILITLFVSFIPFITFAADAPFKKFGDHKVFYSAFNSSFIQPSIADTYRITRGKDKGLINIALIKEGKQGGQSAIVKGTVSNIFAQQQSLKFFEVREGDTVYYLAPFTFENEDFLTFKIEVKAENGSPAYSLNFQKTFYHEDS